MIGCGRDSAWLHDDCRLVTRISHTLLRGRARLLLLGESVRHAPGHGRVAMPDWRVPNVLTFSCRESSVSVAAGGLHAADEVGVRTGLSTVSRGVSFTGSSRDPSFVRQ